MLHGTARSAQGTPVHATSALQASEDMQTWIALLLVSSAAAVGAQTLSVPGCNVQGGQITRVGNSARGMDELV